MNMFKREMNLHERANMVRAMDTIARSCNNEAWTYHWLSMGVADGDVNGEETDLELADYCDDETFSELMEEFLHVMTLADSDGGLYCDWVVSKEAPDGEDE